MRRRGRPGLVGTMARTAVIAGTATAVVGATSGKKQASQQQAAAQQQATMQTQQQMAEMQSELDQIHAKEAAEAQQAAIDQAVNERMARRRCPSACCIRSDGRAPEVGCHEGAGPDQRRRVHGDESKTARVVGLASFVSL